MILGGSFTTIFAKTIEMEVWLPKENSNSQVPNWVLTEFKHPLIMNLLKFAGESVLLPILSFKLLKDPEAARSHVVNKINPLIFTAPAILDTFGSALNFTGLLMIAASTYQIMRMLCMVFVVIFSVTLFRKTYTMLQYTALLFIMGGLLQVTLFDILETEASEGRVHSTYSDAVAKAA